MGDLFGGEDVVDKVPRKVVKVMELDMKIQDCLKAFEEYKTDYLPVYNDKKQIMGVITSRAILNLRTSNVLKKDSEIRRAVNKDFKCVKHSDPMKYLSKSFNRHTHTLVHNSEKSEYSVIE